MLESDSQFRSLWQLEGGVKKIHNISLFGILWCYFLEKSDKFFVSLLGEPRRHFDFTVSRI